MPGQRQFTNRSFTRPAKTLAILIGALLILPLVATDSRSETGTDEEVISELMTLSLEELLEVEVTSVSRRTERAWESAAAIHVITENDIRRSGATSIPELLRGIPGMHVAQVSTDNWAVSARGFNGRFANKLLVQIDERTVYSPFYSGVQWSDQNIPLESVERIEVIRGPGAAMWGANAVNGIINIVTKSSADMQGGTIVSGAGTPTHAFSRVHIGRALGETGGYRLYGSATHRDAITGLTDERGEDDWRDFRGGFRLDWSPGPEYTVAFQGGLHDGTIDVFRAFPTLEAPYSNGVWTRSELSGGNLVTRLQRQLSPTSTVQLRAFFDTVHRVEAGQIDNQQWTLDADWQHGFQASRHDLMWGLGYRMNRDEITAVFLDPIVDPVNRTSHQFSAFVQDDIALARDVLSMTVGARVEHNDYTDFELQPMVRGLWKPGEGQTVWSAFSIASRTPTRIEADGAIPSGVLPPFSGKNPAPLPAQIVLEGSHDFEAERVRALELGYRFTPTSGTHIDVATFHNTYTDLRSFEPGDPEIVMWSATEGYVRLPVAIGNRMDGRSYGVEIGAGWRPSGQFRLRASYTYFDLELTPAPGVERTSAFDEGHNPRHQLYVGPSLRLRRGLELDLHARYVDDLPSVSDVGAIDAYVGLDARLGWLVHPGIELAVVGQNLLGSHEEFVDDLFSPAVQEIRANGFATVRLRF